MIDEGFKVLNKLTTRLNIQPYEDYCYIRELKIDKYLVTSGITSVQKNKIKSLGIEDDFTGIIIDDPFLSTGGKSKIFAGLMEKYSLSSQDMWVIGDNPDSEIAAAKRNKIPTILIDRESKYENDIADYVVHSLKELVIILKSKTRS